MAPKYPSIPEPTLSPESLRDAVLTLKQAFEVLSGQRGNPDYRAVLLPELTAAQTRLTDYESAWTDYTPVISLPVAARSRQLPRLENTRR